MRKGLFFALTAGSALAADLVTKALVEASFSLYETRPVIDGLFNLVYVRNPGAAFGFLAGAPSFRTPLLLAVTALALGGILWLAARTPAELRWEHTGLALVFGGALGNLVDRVRYGEVVDFLDIYWGVHHWPAFNVADAAIVVGASFLLLTELARAKPRS